MVIITRLNIRDTQMIIKPLNIESTLSKNHSLKVWMTIQTKNHQELLKRQHLFLILAKLRSKRKKFLSMNSTRLLAKRTHYLLIRVTSRFNQTKTGVMDILALEQRIICTAEMVVRTHFSKDLVMYRAINVCLLVASVKERPKDSILKDHWLTMSHSKLRA